MSPSSIGKLLSGMFGVSLGSATPRDRIPEGTPSRARPTERGDTDAAVVRIRAQQGGEDDSSQRAERVQRLKQKVSQGMYKVDSEAVAVAVIKELG